MTRFSAGMLTVTLLQNLSTSRFWYASIAAGLLFVLWLVICENDRMDDEVRRAEINLARRRGELEAMEKVKRESGRQQ